MTGIFFAFTREGAALSVITYGMGVHWALNAAKNYPGQVEIVDLRTQLLGRSIGTHKAVEELFDVKVTGVHMVNRKGKPTMRYGRTVSHRPAVRKAYVQLAEGSKTLEFFEGI